MSSDKLFKSLDIVVNVGFFSDADEGPGPLDGVEAVHDHEKGVWVPINLVLLDEGLGLRVNGEDGLVLLVADAVVDAACRCDVSVL